MRKSKQLKSARVHDYIFIGAGPASLAAVSVLGREQNASIVVLDAGGDFARRSCPSLNDKNCTSCSGTGCNVTEGIGGSSAGFGNKLCMLPASRGCVDLVHPALQMDVCEEVACIIGRPVSSVFLTDGAAPVEGDIIVKHYKTDVLFRREYRALVMRLINSAQGQASIRQNSRVVRIQRSKSDEFELTLETGELFRCRNLVFGGGRSSAMSMPELLGQIDVKFEDLYPDVGLRIELDTHLLSSSFVYQDDPKFKIRHRNGATSRTFCTCKDGHIVPVKFGDTYFADGSFLNKPSGKTNVALMIRDNRPLPISDLVKWCANVNAASAGNLLLASIPVAVGQDLEAIRSAIIAAIPTWPTSGHRIAMSELLAEVISDGDMSIGRWTADSGEASINIYAPAIDAYWSKPDLQLGFASSAAGLSVIGDAAGYSRGVVQAIYSGVGWAVHQLRMGLAPNRYASDQIAPESALRS